MRVHAKPFGSYPFYLRPFFWNQRRKYVEVLQAALLWARVPKLFAAVAALFGVIDRSSSPIDPALRSLVTVLVSQINTCSFCVDLNSATLMKRGVSGEKVETLETWRQSNLFDRRERTVLDYAEAMTRSDLQQSLVGPAHAFCSVESVELRRGSRRALAATLRTGPPYPAGARPIILDSIGVYWAIWSQLARDRARLASNHGWPRGSSNRQFERSEDGQSRTHPKPRRVGMGSD